MFIELHDSFRNHVKVRRLAKRLGITRRDARGLLVSLWLEVLRVSPMDGVLSDWDAEEIAEACDWDPSADSPRTVRGMSADNPPTVEGASVLLNALTDPRICILEQFEDGYRVHDWGDYTVYLRRRIREAERKKSKRREVTGENENQSHRPRTVRGLSADNVPQPEPEPEPEPEPLTSEFDSYNSQQESDFLDLEQLANEGFKQYGILGGSYVAALGRYTPVARWEWDAVLKTRGRSWGYVLRVLQGIREERDRPPPPPTGTPPPDMDKLWGEVKLIAQGTQRDEHSDEIAREAIRRLGGRQALARMTDYEFSKARVRFAELYRQGVQ